MTPRLAHAPLPPAEIVIRRVRIFDPAEGIDLVADVHVRDGLIAAIGPALNAAHAGEIAADGRFLLPGLIDPHVHLRTPGQEYKEDLATGSAAGAAGGYTAVLAMPNTDPVLDEPALLDALLGRAAMEAVIPVGSLAAISRGLAGEVLTEMGELVDRGAAGFTDDGKPVVSGGMLRRAFQYARPLGVPVALHCEEPGLSRGGQMHEGAVSAMLGLRGYPGIAESVMVARDVRIAAYEDARVHLQHLSTRESVEEVVWARAHGVRVSAEATPHHLLLTHEAVRHLDPATTKMNPPLASEEDRLALLDAVRDGTVDIIATDHAPHSALEKEVPFEAAPFGVTGLETSFAAIYTDLVLPGLLSLACVLTRMSAAPASAFGLDRPRIAVGAQANFALWDLERPWAVTPAAFRSKSANNAFLGRTLRGRCLLTLAAGRIAHSEDR